MTESQMQSECFIWFWNTYPDQRRMLLHVDNNSFNAIEGNRKKAMGVVKGVSDFILILPGMVMFIELKLPTGRQSDEQIDFQKKVVGRSHPYTIIRSVNQFKELIWQVIGKR